MLAKPAMTKSVLLFLLLFSGFSSFAQKNISGKVLDADSKPLGGVTIKGVGTDKNVVSASDGTFSISIPSTVNQLEVSTIGFQTAKVNIEGKSSVDIILVQQLSTLNEVVVVGYGTQKRKDLTGAVSSVTASTIAKVPVTTIDQ